MRGWPAVRAFVVGAGLLGLGVAASACGPGKVDWSDGAVAKGEQGVQAHVINSQVAVGPTRLGFGLFDKDGALIHDAKGTVKLFTLKGDEPTEAGEHELRAVHVDEKAHPGHDHDPLATMYVANVDIDHKEWWGAELHIQAGGKKYTQLRTRFFAAEKATVPGIGKPAPRTNQPVLRNVKDIAEIDSSTPPLPQLHELTVAEAIDTKKPSVIAFATPAFCQTRFCGPVVEGVVAPLAQEYKGRVNFVHIEPYRLAEARQGRLVPIPEMAEWGLASEPYIFVLDGKGLVAAQFEGIVEKDEVSAVLDRLIKG